MQISTPEHSKIDLSIVTTMYQSAPYLKEFTIRTQAKAESLTPDYELIFVNDGSPDDSLDVVLSLAESNPRIRIIDLSRNFGQHKAMMCGLRFAQGDLVFMIDCDLEEDPESIGQFYAELKKTGADAVYGVQDARHGSLSKRVCGTLFYKILNFFSDISIPSNVLCSRLMTRRFVNSLLAHQEREIFIAGLYANTGYKQVPLKATKSFKGATSYNLTRKVSMAVEGVVSFSNRPLYFIFYLGIGVMLISGSASIWLVIMRIIFSKYSLGWPSLIISIWFLGGVTIFCLGVIGIYLSKVFSEVKQRPASIVRKIYENPFNHRAKTQAPHLANDFIHQNQSSSITTMNE